MQYIYSLSICNWFKFTENESHQIREDFISQSCFQKIAVESQGSFSFDKLKSLVGEDRLKRICAKPEIQIDYLEMQDNLTPEAAQKIFWGMADVRQEDLEEKSLQLQQKSIQDLTEAELDKVYLSLLPNFSDNFDYDEHSPIEYYDKCQTSGKGFQGLKERVWIIMGMAKDSLNAHDYHLPAHLKEIETLASRLADRELPKGTLLRLQEGFFAVDEIFAAGGSFVSVLRQLKGQNALINCRGTAARRTAHGGYLSGANDLQIEIGLLGISKIWPDLASYLNANPYARIEVLGKSLGGGHAQYLAGLIGGLTDVKLNSVITVGSIGVPQVVHDIFEQAFLDKEKPWVKRLHNWGKDDEHEIDYIPEFGGKHLSTHDERTTYYQLIPADDQDDQSHAYENAFPQQTLFGLGIKTLMSFTKAHTRQTTMRPFHIRVLKHPEHSIEPVNHRLEKIRNLLAYTLHCFTLGYLNPISFDEFYRNLKEE